MLRYNDDGSVYDDGQPNFSWVENNVEPLKLTVTKPPPAWVDATPAPMLNPDSSPAEIAAYRTQQSVKRPDRGPQEKIIIPEQDKRPSYIMEPDLQELQGGQHFPPGLMQDDSGRLYYQDDPTKTVPMVQRPGLLPLARTPDGVKLVMPKLLDVASNVMGNVGGKVTAKAGEMVLGSGVVRPTVDAAKSAIATPFYSQLERTVQAAKINLATPEQWLGYLKNQPGVKSEELSAVLGDLPKEGMLSKEQLADYVKQNKVELKEKVLGGENDTTKLREEYERLNPKPANISKSEKTLTGFRDKMHPDYEQWIRDRDEWVGKSSKPTKYHQYQFPGGENYKEMLLSLPKNPERQKIINEHTVNRLRLDAIDERLHDFGSILDKDEVLKLAHEKVILDSKQKELARKLDAAENTYYKAPHFDEHGTNLVGHVRTNERTLPIEFTAEEKVALQKHEEAQPYLDKLQQSQRDVALAIKERVKPLEDFRQNEIRKDLKAGKISPVEARKELEKYVEYPTIKPLQDKLVKLREEENNVRKALPVKPEAINEKGTHIEELQGDWGQNIRDKGFKGEKEKLQPDFDKVEEKLMATNDDKLLGLPTVKQVLEKAVTDGVINKQEAATYKRYTDIENSTPVPDMPFKKNWDEVLIKRIIRDAVDKGHKFITVTPGEAQALRYQNEIRQKIDTVNWVKSSSLEGNKIDRVVRIKPSNGSELILDIDKDGIILNGHKELKGKTLDEAIGKDIARQIFEKPEGNIDAKGYVMGAEGMKGYYDKMVVSKFDNIVKKYGTRLEPFGAEFKTGGKITDTTRETKHKVHIMRITPELEKKAKEGFELFSSSPTLSLVTHNPFDDQEKKQYRLVPVQGNPFQ